MDEIAQQAAFKWRRTLIDWTYFEEEGYLSVLLTNLAHKVRINILPEAASPVPKVLAGSRRTIPVPCLRGDRASRNQEVPDQGDVMPRKTNPPADLSRGAGTFQDAHALAKTAEMVADENKGRVMQFKHYPDQEILVVLLEDGRKFRVHYPPRMVPKKP